jgi:hypothetical protein
MIERRSANRTDETELFVPGFVAPSEFCLEFVIFSEDLWTATFLINEEGVFGLLPGAA